MLLSEQATNNRTVNNDRATGQQVSGTTSNQTTEQSFQHEAEQDNDREQQSQET
jgi:hypothetical protein